MTAEVAVMNKMAIALATDSAVTSELPFGSKIYNTANKLFALSKHHPIGIMIYGNTEFMGIPWETIIKIYRTKIKNKMCDTLSEYASDFISFLKGTNLFPENEQKNHLKILAKSYFDSFIIKNIDEKVKQEIIQKNRMVSRKINKITVDFINSAYDDLIKLKNLPEMDADQSKKVIIKYSDIISEAVKKSFINLPLTKSSLKKLSKIVGNLSIKDIFSNMSSGIVIAGFGENDIFPSVESFVFETVLNNNLKYKKNMWQNITFSSSAAIIPFAQSDMVSTFVEGIDPDLKESYEEYLRKLFAEYPDYVINNIKITTKEKEKIKEKLREIGGKVIEDFKIRMQKVIDKTHITPVLDAVGMLPKDELASMAEAFVNLTSTKRKISMDAETVGGPIDVAVISKGDGFVWIKRKHYFKLDINPQFSLKYLTDKKGEYNDEEKYC